MEKWSNEQLRWYLDSPGPKYFLQHWWEKEAEVDTNYTPLDDESPLLWELDYRRRKMIRLVP